MDSPTVVCIADRILELNAAPATRLDTISYISSSEPNWDELPYITKVEEQRGRRGYHIDVTASNFMNVDNQKLCLTPGAVRSDSTATTEWLGVLNQGYRVVLSGIGGDEVTGGVPTPLPELQDLIASARLKMLAHRLKVWALEKRKPWFHLLFDALREFFPPQLLSVPKQRRPAEWLTDRFVRKNLAALLGYPKRLTLFGPDPSFQENISTINVLRRQLEAATLPEQPTYETRYPFLDRNLLEFLIALPREQLVRPGMRRSLMRRALVGIVPQELIHRRRKATVTRGPRVSIAEHWPLVLSLAQNSVGSSLGMFDEQQLVESLQKARKGEEVRVVALMRTLGIEHWLRNVRSHKLQLRTASESDGSEFLTSEVDSVAARGSQDAIAR